MPTTSSSRSSRRRKREPRRREPWGGSGPHMLLGAGRTWRCISIATSYRELASGDADSYLHTAKGTVARRVRRGVPDAVAAPDVARDLGERTHHIGVHPREVRQTASDLRELAQHGRIRVAAARAVVGRHSVDHDVAPDGAVVHLLLRIAACV